LKKLRNRVSEIDTTEEQEEEEEKKTNHMNQAEKDLEDHKINGYKLKHHQIIGDKHYYKCEKNCPVKMYLKLDQESSKCFLHVTIIGL